MDYLESECRLYSTIYISNPLDFTIVLFITYCAAFPVSLVDIPGEKCSISFVVVREYGRAEN